MSVRLHACAACGCEVLGADDVALAEAAAVFRPEELMDTAIVCDDCWKAMRQDMPDLDARYTEQGL